MANDQKDKKTLTDEEKNQHIKKTVEEIEKQKKNVKKGDNFTAPTEEQLRKKFERIDSPYIYFQSWSGAAPGGTVNYTIGVTNPDPTQAIWIFAHVFVGSGNVVSSTGEFLLNVDARFPRLTQPDFAGLTLASGAWATLTFSIQIPSSIDHPANYIGNTALFQLNWHDVGTFLDRSVFVIKVP